MERWRIWRIDSLRLTQLHILGTKGRQEHGQAAGRSTDTLPGAENLFLPLMNGEKVIGVVGIAIDTRKLSPEERAVLGAWVSLLAIALVRAGLSSEAKQAAMLREADKLRTALFNSVSHELRTPLAAIMASVYTLNDKAVAYGEKQRQQLLETIADASKRMERIIGNLLDTARLESGMLQLKLDWCDLEDVVSGALRRSKEHTQSYKIKVEIADDLPLIYADAALLEHVVLNLLDNAVKYSVEGSEIEIQTCLDDSEVIVMVKRSGGWGVDGQKIYRICSINFTGPDKRRKSAAPVWGWRSAKALSMPTAAGSGLNSALVAAVFLLLPCL